ncbi:RloB family protein [Streptomyces sp. NPDC050610]|uniref:RloB family protein n=1 Tax=Streptomyces sp. NPDC050610 TaxID=3157097 RepID=UPI003443F77B
MARADKGGDRLQRNKSGAKGRQNRSRQVYAFIEGEVTEREYISLIAKHGRRADPRRGIDFHIENATAAGKHRKPLPMVRNAISVLQRVEREAEAAGLGKEKDWNWPQVWVLFDRDAHEGIPEAMKLAREHGVRIAYSHPCFELWRLLHYQDYTSTFGGVCRDTNARLRRQPGFAQTYGKNVRAVSEQQSKHLQPEQILGNGKYEIARKHAKKINEKRDGENPNHWDPYTDVWTFVEDGLLLSGY